MSVTTSNAVMMQTVSTYQDPIFVNVEAGGPEMELYAQVLYLKICLSTVQVKVKEQ